MSFSHTEVHQKIISQLSAERVRNMRMDLVLVDNEEKKICKQSKQTRWRQYDSIRRKHGIELIIIQQSIKLRSFDSHRRDLKQLMNCAMNLSVKCGQISILSTS